ncbi:MAG TPA: 6-carboxytetrahydropterin synthase QueD [Desulfomonilaceae bacterium]|nr:6-carboxytetrahydropterin synthase QueD [Desulfomonilaceae bacterium]
MYEVEITAWFCAAHKLRDYHGKCEHLHGHNYKVTVAARSHRPGRGGMVIDFGDLKKAAAQVLGKVDHGYLNEIPPFDEIEPSAENIACFLFDAIAENLGNEADLLFSVSVWESASSRATYFRDPQARVQPESSR